MKESNMEIEQNGAGDPTTTTTTYTQVIYKKRQGMLTLTSVALSFRSSSGGENENTTTTTTTTPLLTIGWSDVLKHQVSPATYPKALLKLILKNNNNTNNNNSGSSSSSPNKNNTVTFQLPNRPELERIRKDITARLQAMRTSSSTSSSGLKRPFAELEQSKSVGSSSFGELDATALAVTRSSLLAANKALRQQHTYLVEETQTVSEQDFWKTHQHLIQEEYAKISGMAKAGTSSLLQSHLPSSGRVVLGVEEMRQIFILYPAVHQAYEEKVPLELSDEQFWRKYLESEYFHRDRGRMGTAARNHAAASGGGTSGREQQQQTQQREQEATNGNKRKSSLSSLTVEEQDARAAAVGTDDLFSRYDQKLKEQLGETTTDNKHKNWGRKLAVGQFDLASTFETERGELLAAPKDNFPDNIADDGKGARVIRKYNRHWSMVLHPDDAVAGSNLMDVARKSVDDVLPNDSDAQCGGGVDDEMRRLVGYAQATEEEADHAAGVGHHDDYEQLALKNVEAYYTGQTTRKSESTEESEEKVAKRHSDFAKAMAAKTQALLMKPVDTTTLPQACFPPAGLGRELLSALTKKMAKDSRTEEASLEMVNKLPEDFRNRLQSYFRRSSELLRHFFGLRRLEAEGSSGYSQKLARIVRGMETLYREMEGMRKSLPQTETGEIMGKMCLPIMDQLNRAFQLHRQGTGGGGGGGFVAVDET